MGLFGGMEELRQFHANEGTNETKEQSARTEH